jgi:uncharacterized Zn-binding protein involved in type VI secretion
MGKPAARMFLDTGAHVGPIMIGSFNVIIGGGLAARKGDPIVCSAHGQCSIVDGSTSVFINGKPAARMGDKTSCGTPPSPPEVGPKPAETEYNFISIIPNYKSNKDGTIDHSLDENLSLKAFNAYANFSDKTKDGSHDYMEAGAVAFEMGLKGDYKPFDGKYGGVGGSAGFSKYKVEVKAGAYGSNGMYGAEAEGKASMMSGNAEGHIGKEGGIYHKSEVKADVAYAEAKGEAVLHTGGSENKYGFQVEGSADAGAVKADYEGQSDFLGIIKTKAKVGLKGGSGAIGGKAGLYVDTDDFEISANLGGEIAALIGIKADLELTLSAKPIVDGIKNLIDYFVPPVVEGSIITGAPNILIG